MLSRDTHPDVERIQIELLRRTPVPRKLELVAQMHQTVRTLAMVGLRSRHPHEDHAQLRRRLARSLLGEALASAAYRSAPPFVVGASAPDSRAIADPHPNMDMELSVPCEGFSRPLTPRRPSPPATAKAVITNRFTDSLVGKALLPVTRALDRLGVPYVLAGAFASATYGLMRSTRGADLVANLGMSQGPPLARTLAKDFYADAEMILDAIRHHSSFNLIHLDTMFKVDVFVSKPRVFDRAQLNRRQAHDLGGVPGNRVYLASPEDTVLAKLEWYRMGGEASERQWRDVLGVLRVQGDRLDRRYMREMAKTLDVVDLLERALDEAA